MKGCDLLLTLPCIYQHYGIVKWISAMLCVPVQLGYYVFTLKPSFTTTATIITTPPAPPHQIGELHFMS